MNFQKYKILMIGGGIALALFIAGLVFLFRLQGEYNRTKRDFQAAQGEITRIGSAPISPTTNNIRILEENARQVEQLLSSTLESMAEEQVESLEISRADFPALLERTFLSLGEVATESQVQLPERFAFGFDRYAAGSLPNLDQIPRLTRQLIMVKELVETISRSGVRELTEVSREEFEDILPDDPLATADSRDMSRGAAARSQAGRGDQSSVPDPLAASLYSAERFTLSFAGRDEAIWKALNALSSHKLFVVVRSVTLQNEAYTPKESPESRSSTGRSRAPARTRAPARSLGSLIQAASPTTTVTTDGVELPRSHEERVVAGRELVRATLEVEVYRFKLETAEGEVAP